MGEWLLLTNNPLILENHVDAEIEEVRERGLGAVLEKALEMAQSGCRLISAPLPPNVPLIRAPYRTLLMRRHGRQYDVRGIMALEKARQTALKLGTAAYEEGPARDAAFIDREILLRTIQECGNS